MMRVVSDVVSALEEAEALSRRIYRRDRKEAGLIDRVADLWAEWDSAVACQDVDWMGEVACEAQALVEELGRYRIYRFQLADDRDEVTSVGVEFAAKDLPEAIRYLMDWAPDLEYFIYKGSAKP